MKSVSISYCLFRFIWHLLFKITYISFQQLLPMHDNELTQLINKFVVEI